LAIRIKRADLEAIKKHGEQTYPHECCGFLIGASDEGTNVLHQIFAAENEWPDQPATTAPEVATRPSAQPGEGVAASTATETPAEASGATKVESQRNRYLITPEQWKRADAHARKHGLGIVGYYHSHPDHPAAPSGFDLDHSCWPGESYIIVSIQQGRAADINSFTKPDYSQFEKEAILVED
jgi:proteasome lid subunit RPN8/RPN11